MSGLVANSRRHILSCRGSDSSRSQFLALDLEMDFEIIRLCITFCLFNVLCNEKLSTITVNFFSLIPLRMTSAL